MIFALIFGSNTRLFPSLFLESMQKRIVRLNIEVVNSPDEWAQASFAHEFSGPMKAGEALLLPRPPSHNLQSVQAQKFADDSLTVNVSEVDASTRM
jgi:hypothetical protein